MKHSLRSAVCTEGRRMAGARALWVATGMKQEQFGKPIIAIVNSSCLDIPICTKSDRLSVRKSRRWAVMPLSSTP